MSNLLQACTDSYLMFTDANLCTVIIISRYTDFGYLIAISPAVVTLTRCGLWWSRYRAYYVHVVGMSSAGYTGLSV